MTAERALLPPRPAGEASEPVVVSQTALAVHTTVVKFAELGAEAELTSLRQPMKERKRPSSERASPPWLWLVCSETTVCPAPRTKYCESGKLSVCTSIPIVLGSVEISSR